MYKQKMSDMPQYQILVSSGNCKIAQPQVISEPKAGGDAPHLLVSSGNCKVAQPQVISEPEAGGDAPHHEPSSAETPEILRSDYRFLRLLGEGSNGKTFLAAERVSGRKVAIKQLKSFKDFKSFDLFKREAETMRSVAIDGVPQFIDYIEKTGSEDDYYIVQEYIEGTPLSGLIDSRAESDKPFSEDFVWNFARQIARILDILETRYHPPIIHRDIKPSNIIMTAESNFYLIDFGSVANPERKNLNSTIAGTQGYMAPEQLMGDCVIQSDYYGLGATMLHLLTGVAPFKIASDGLKLCYEDIIKQKARKTSSAMRKALASLLAVKPEDRPQNSDALQELLQALPPKKQAQEEKSRKELFRDYMIGHPRICACGHFLSKHKILRFLIKCAFAFPIAWQWTACSKKRRESTARSAIAVASFILIPIYLSVFALPFIAPEGLEELFANYQACIVLAIMLFLSSWYVSRMPLIKKSKSSDGSDSRDFDLETFNRYSPPCLYRALWYFEYLEEEALRGMNSEIVKNRKSHFGHFIPTAIKGKIQKVTGDAARTAYYTVLHDGDVYAGTFEFMPSDRKHPAFCNFSDDFRQTQLFNDNIENNDFLPGTQIDVLCVKMASFVKLALSETQTDWKMNCLMPLIIRHANAGAQS